MTRRVWVVSDGTTMAAIDSSTLLWSSPLPQGAAELNSLGVQDPPRWLVHQGAIVMAHPDGIVALDPVDGSTVWRVAGPVTSWSASGDALVVLNGPTASLLSFGKNSATATALPSSAPTTASAPDQEDLKNSTLEVPDLCKPSRIPRTRPPGKTLAAFRRRHGHRDRPGCGAAQRHHESAAAGSLRRLAGDDRRPEVLRRRQYGLRRDRRVRLRQKRSSGAWTT